MKRVFCDLHLKVNPNDIQATKCAIQKAAELGFHALSIPLNPLDDAQAANIEAQCSQVGLDFVSRVDLKPRSQDELTRLLRRFRRRFTVVCIVCGSKEVARQAAKDRRVDLLNFPSLDYHKRFFDRAEAELASSGLSALEVDVLPLLVLEGPSRARLLSSLHREVAVAGEFKVPVVVSSGAGEGYFMRSPRELASLAYLFGLTEPQALETVSSNPNLIVCRNREKLTPNFIAPGIRVVKEGKTS